MLHRELPFLSSGPCRLRRHGGSCMSAEHVWEQKANAGTEIQAEWGGSSESADVPRVAEARADPGKNVQGPLGHDCFYPHQLRQADTSLPGLALHPPPSSVFTSAPRPPPPHTLLTGAHASNQLCSPLSMPPNLHLAAGSWVCLHPSPHPALSSALAAPAKVSPA